MAQPTIATRLQRKFLVMSRDQALLVQLREQMSPGWEMVAITDLEQAGGWQDLLLYRFLLLDLDETEAFDPLDVMHSIRMEHQLQIAVFCFGGSRMIRDSMRVARADRFFERDQIAAALPQFLEQYGWGGSPNRND